MAPPGTEGLAWFGSVIAFAVATSATPGPNNAMVAASGASWGFRRTVPHMLGITLGFAFMILAVALGAGELFRTHPAAHGVLRWVGAAYLLWLAWRIATATPNVVGEDRPDGGPAAGRPLGFVKAALFQWVNPKAWVIAVGAVVTYTASDGGGLLVQSVMLALVFLLITLPMSALWTLVGVGAARLLRTSRAVRWFNVAMAALLVVSLLPLLRGEG